MSKAQKIKQLLQQGKSPSEIAAKLSTSKQYVYTINSKMSRKKPTEPAQKVSFWSRLVMFFKRSKK